MARLIYSSISSLDGYIADSDGDFQWAAPDAVVHGFINDVQRSARTFLFGRRMWETMRAWESIDDDEPVMRDFAAQWHAADKLVYSHTLDQVDTARTELRHDFDVAEVVRLKERSQHDLVIGGPGLAAEALRAGMVDEIHQFVCPFIVGGGTRFLPDGLRMPLQLIEERRFEPSGVVYLRYGVASAPTSK